MKKIIVSAPGKIHLSGEHAVVHGKPAVVVAISKRLYITLTDVSAPQGAAQSLSEVRKKDAFIDAILVEVEKKYKRKVQNVGLTIHSDIPRGAGMGSSASLAVALTGGILQLLGQPWNVSEINELAYQAEKFQNLNSSGSDSTIATHGGLLWYRKELDFLKTFWLLPFKIPKTFAPFTLINTGRSERTGDLVAYVEDLRQQNEQAFTLLISEIEETTRNLVQAIHDEKEKDMHKAISENEHLLEELGVVSMSVKTLIREIEESGGVAKISGAGGIKNGSGIVIAVHADPQKIKDTAKQYGGYDAFSVQLGGGGVRVEQVLT